MKWLPRRSRWVRVGAIGIFLVAGLARSTAQATDRRPISELDLFRFVWGADPSLSPDGSRAAFVRVNVTRDREDYESSVWVVPTTGGEPRRLTLGPRDTGPRWSPDGSRMLFLRRVEADGKVRPPQVFVLNLDGGEPRAWTDLPDGASAPAWSPDGKTIAFLNTTTPVDLARAANRAKGMPVPRESDVRIVTRAEFRNDRSGYRDPDHPAQIWTVAAPSVHADDRPPPPKRLTSGPYPASDPTWSPDGKRLFFLSTRDPEPAHSVARSALDAVGVEGGPVERIAAINGSLSAPSPSADGRWVACRGTLADPPRSYTPADLFVVDLTLGPEQSPRNLTLDFDFDIGGSISGDQHPPRAGAPTRPAWTQGGTALVDKVARHGQANLEAFDLATGQNRPLTAGDRDLSSFAPSANGSKLVALAQTATTLPDLFLIDLAPPRLVPPQRLTDLNAPLWAKLDLTEPESITATSFDGRAIPAFLQKPPGFDPSKKYPLILNIHGGPHAAYGSTFSHEFHWMAARGYVVLYPNPRGSSSYGSEFGNIIQHHYPGDDFLDLMACVDEVIRRSYIDPGKLAITGGSGGGLLTNWAITRTDRFAAAVSQRSIADWSAWWYSADFTLFQPTWFRSTPFRDPADFATRSPITQVEKINTPLMLIEGETDLRTPSAAGGETMFRALKYLKKPTVMIRFPGESHDLSRSGKPWHRVERLQHIVAWFDRYLLGKPAPVYEPNTNHD